MHDIEFKYFIYEQNKLPPGLKKELKAIDKKLFGDSEPIVFKDTDWVFITAPESGDIFAYGAIRNYSDYHYLSRCGVVGAYQGNGLQKELIKSRIALAKTSGNLPVITYTMHNNPASMNSLIACGFKTYRPGNKWAGKEMVYWNYEPSKY